MGLVIDGMLLCFSCFGCVNVSMDEAVNASSVTSIHFNLIRAVSSNELPICVVRNGSTAFLFECCVPVGGCMGCYCC